MASIKIYKYLFNLMAGVLLLSAIACSDSDTEIPIIDPDNPTKPEDLKGILESAITEWGTSYEQIVSSMKGYNQVNSSKDDILIFKAPKGRQGVSYYFSNGKLCATSIIFPATSTDINWQSLLGKYSFDGELGGGKVYDNQMGNTMAAVWQTTEYDSTLCAIGFAPIKSDLYEDIAPITVTTEDNVDMEAFSANIYGKVTGVDKDVEVGIIYGKNNDISEITGKKVSTTSRGAFNVTIKGLIGEQTYYYRAYALIDDIYYLSEIKSLVSKPTTYTIDGNTFKMVRVEGGTLPTFYIMQTELPSNKDIVIGTAHIAKLNKNDDRAVIKTEFGKFLDNIRESTGIPFRLPTKEEWQYAARGGYNESDYIYSGSNNIEDVAWYKGNCGKKGHTIATKSPNALGLYDMSGNYSELCNDKDDIYYVDGALCGGSWNDNASSCTVSSSKEGIRTGNIPGTHIKEKNAFDAYYITVRLVYSEE